MSQKKLDKQVLFDAMSMPLNAYLDGKAVMDAQTVLTIIALIEIRESIDEAKEKICESVDVFINAKIASDKVIEGILKDIRASIDDAGKQH